MTESAVASLALWRRWLLWPDPHLSFLVAGKGGDIDVTLCPSGRLRLLRLPRSFSLELFGLRVVVSSVQIVFINLILLISDHLLLVLLEFLRHIEGH